MPTFFHPPATTIATTAALVWYTKGMSATTRIKPPKVRGSPLTPHPNGQYVKKINGRLRYFGADHEAALARYLREASDLAAGIEPRRTIDPCDFTIDDLVNEYLEARYGDVEAGDLSARQFQDYRAVAQMLADAWGKALRVESLTPADFGRLRARMSERWGLTRLGNQVGRVRTMFKWAADNGFLRDPIRFGDQFQRPPARLRRIARRERGKRLFTTEEVRGLIQTARGNARAMVLLGINAAFGNKDCSDLRIEHVDLAKALIDHFRMKTGIERTAPLWPETVEALRECIGDRTDGPVFVTRFGNAFVRDKCAYERDGRLAKVTPIDKVGDLFRKISPKPRLPFYCLRHTFATIAHETRDGLAVSRIMGHALTGMTAVYVEEIGIERLRQVVEHVRGRVLTPSGGAGPSVDGEPRPAH